MKAIRPLPLFGTLSIIVALAVNLHAQSILSNGLVAHYPLDGNTYDASGNGRSLLNSGAKANSAYSFNGSSSILIETNSADSLVLHEACTFSCWVNIPSTGRYSLVRKDGDALIAFLNLQTNVFYVEVDRNGTEYRGFSEAPPLGSWSMLTATWDGTSFVQYINGQRKASIQNEFPNSLLPTASISVGGSTIYGEFLLGELSDVRIYNRALSTSEVQQLFTYEAGLFVNLIKAVKPSFSNPLLGTNYQLQVSSDMTTRTNQGAWGKGTIFTISSPPALTLTNTGPSVVLTWPTNASGFTLQSTTNLSLPVWTTNFSAPIVINGQNTVTTPISGTQQFFRLSQ